MRRRCIKSFGYGIHSVLYSIGQTERYIPFGYGAFAHQSWLRRLDHTFQNLLTHRIYKQRMVRSGVPFVFRMRALHRSRNRPCVFNIGRHRSVKYTEGSSLGRFSPIVTVESTCTGIFAVLTSDSFGAI